MDITEIAEGTYQLSTPLPWLDSVFSVFLIAEDDGFLLEPGLAAAVPAILEGMKHLGMTKLAYIMPTHIHMDHAAGAGMLAEKFPEAMVVLHPDAVRHATDPSQLIASTKKAFGDDFESRYGPIMPIPAHRIKVPEDGEVIAAAGRSLRAIYSPGHAPHHIAFLDLKTHGMFCGEALGTPLFDPDSPLPSVAPPAFDMEVYLQTLEKLRAFRPKFLAYSHDGVGRDPDKLISRTAENTRTYGDLILSALRAGEPPETIGARVREQALRQFGRSPEKNFEKMLVTGYTMFFKKKGLA